MGNHLSVFIWNCNHGTRNKKTTAHGPCRDDDAYALALGLNNLNVSRNLARVPHPYALEDAQAFIALQRNFDARDAVCAIAFRAAPEELIGMVSYEYGIKGDEANFGYWLTNPAGA